MTQFYDRRKYEKAQQLEYDEWARQNRQNGAMTMVEFRAMIIDQFLASEITMKTLLEEWEWSGGSEITLSVALKEANSA